MYVYDPLLHKALILCFYVRTFILRKDLKELSFLLPFYIFRIHLVCFHPIYSVKLQFLFPYTALFQMREMVEMDTNLSHPRNKPQCANTSKTFLKLANYILKTFMHEYTLNGQTDRQS